MPMGEPAAHAVLRATARNDTRFGGLRNIRSPAQDLVLRRCQFRRSAFRIMAPLIPQLRAPNNKYFSRSEERRVGKECRL